MNKYVYTLMLLHIALMHNSIYDRLLNVTDDSVSAILDPSSSLLSRFTFLDYSFEFQQIWGNIRSNAVTCIAALGWKSMCSHRAPFFISEPNAMIKCQHSSTSLSYSWLPPSHQFYQLPKIADMDLQNN